MSAVVIKVVSDIGFDTDSFVKQILSAFPLIDILSPDLEEYEFFFDDIEEAKKALAYLYELKTIKIKCMKIEYDL